MNGKTLYLPAGLVLLFVGCGEEPRTPTYAPGSSKGPAPVQQDTGYGGYGDYYSTGTISFLDDVKSNVDAGDNLAGLTFVDVDGNETHLDNYMGQKSVVLVITRGNTNPICPYCTTQTSRLIFNYPKFQERNAEVLVVYPIEHNDDKDKLASFLEKSKALLDDPSQSVPFPILLDVELKAVNQLGIRKDLSKPATYILDPEGKVRFAYVGADLDDRPSVDAMLKELDAIIATPDGDGETTGDSE